MIIDDITNLLMKKDELVYDGAQITTEEDRRRLVEDIRCSLDGGVSIVSQWVARK